MAHPVHEGLQLVTLFLGAERINSGQLLRQPAQLLQLPPVPGDCCARTGNAVQQRQLRVGIPANIQR